MSLGVLLGLAVGALLITALASVGSHVFHDLAWHELEEYCRKRKRRELFDQIHDHADEAAVAADLLQVIGVTLLVLTSAAAFLLRPGAAVPPGGAQTLLATLLLVVALMAVTVWIPRAVAELWSGAFLFHTWTWWRALRTVFLPLALAVPLVRTLLRRLSGQVEEPDEEEAFEDEIRTMVSEGHRDGLLEADAREMIEGVMELDDADVADIMTPRSKVDAMPVDLEWAELLRRVIQFGRTRIPIYEEKLDNIVGILYVKDLLPELAKEDPQARGAVRDILREPWFVTKTRRLDDLLQDFLQTRNHMAIVVDEYMAVAGLVTIEDVLEEIVGEIVDESDKEDLEEITSVDENTAEIDARAHLCEINERLGLDFPEPDDFDTLGGFVVNQLGRIPHDGEQITWNHLRITILAANRRRVERVRVELLDGSTSQTA